MRINQNIAAFNAYRNLSVTSGQQAKSLEKLSSGFRINRAADDAAGLVNSENLRAQIGGLKVATRNAQDAISLVQTAEGAQTEVHSILQRMRDLVVQTGNSGTNDTAAVSANQAEIDQLKEELTRIADQTQFGTKKILNGDSATDRTLSLTFQVGANSGQTVSVDINAVKATDLGHDGAATPAAITYQLQVDSATDALETRTAQFGNVDEIDFSGTLEAGTADYLGRDMDLAVSDALAVIDQAISSVSANRADLGAFQNRMEATIRNVSVATENLQAAESRIRDVDMAAEMVSFTRHQIMQQAGTAMLAQANQVPQSVLSLLR